MEAVKNQNHPKYMLALAALQSTRNRQARTDLQNKDVKKVERTTKSVKAVNEEKEVKGIEAKGTLKIHYQKAAADAINKVKQNLATKETEQRLRQEIERQQRGEKLSG